MKIKFHFQDYKQKFLEQSSKLEQQRLEFEAEISKLKEQLANNAHIQSSKYEENKEVLYLNL